MESLYNLGMVYSDRMQLTEARQLLSRAVELDPGHANGLVALGIAALRDNDPDAAQGPLEKAVVLEPRNPVALRTLGQLRQGRGVLYRCWFNPAATNMRRKEALRGVMLCTLTP